MIPGYLSLVFDHLWQSTLGVGVVTLLTWTLRGNRAAVRHRLWVVASIKFLIPFAWLIEAGHYLDWRRAAATPPALWVAVAEQTITPSRLITVELPAETTTNL